MADLRRKLRSVNIDELGSDSHWIRDLREKTLTVFSVRPCLWQMKVSLAVLKGHKNVCCIAGTGSGKTITFWMPLLLRDGMQIVVVPLNILGKQNVDQLRLAGIPAVTVTADTATEDTFKEIENGAYRVVITNPEMLLKQQKFGFSKLFKKKKFVEQIISIIFDEAHCISQWGSFRPEYKEIGRLVHILDGVVFHLTSATLPKVVLEDVLETLHIHVSKLFVMRRSSDRPNVFLVVREIESPLSSYEDLKFLLPAKEELSNDRTSRTSKFLVIFDTIFECVNACLIIRAHLPPEHRNRVKWHHSEMSDTYRAETLDELKTGNLLGVFATDTLGTGADIPDIGMVVLWRVNRLSVCSLWQRVGRGARSPFLEAVAVLFAERRVFDTIRTEKEARKRHREALKSAKGGGSTQVATRPSKRRKLGKENITPSPRGTETVSADGPGIAMVDAPSSNQDPPVVSTSLPPPTAHPLDPVSDDVRRSRKEAYLKYHRSQVDGGVQGVRAAKPRWTGRAGRKDFDNIDPAVEDIVNAHDRGLRCRRVPARVVFEEELIDFDHRQCDTSSSVGCTRCGPRPSRLCCDICNPSDFTSVARPREQTSSSTKPDRRSRLKEHPRMDFGKLLWGLLDDWRRIKALELYGPAVAKHCGPAVVMPRGIIDRVVDCAQHEKIKDITDLRRETSWNCPDNHGQTVVTIVVNHGPPPPPLSNTSHLSGAPPLPSRPREVLRSIPSPEANLPLHTDAPLQRGPTEDGLAPIPASQFYGVRPLVTEPPRQPSLPNGHTTHQDVAHPPKARCAEPAGPPRKTKCSMCSGQGHNKRTCPRRVPK